MKPQTVHYIIETEAGRYLCPDGETSNVLDEAEVFTSRYDAGGKMKWGQKVRRIECVVGQETVLLPA
jgi:hypothetical protein